MKLNDIRELCSQISGDINTLKKLVTDTSDPSIRSERKILCSKLAKNFSDVLQAYQQLSKEWLVKEKKAIPAPSTRQSEFSYVFLVNLKGVSLFIVFLKFSIEILS